MIKRYFPKIFFASLITINSAVAEEVLVEESSFSETYSANVPVSGRVLTGIAISKNSATNFQFLLPRDAQGERMCFRVSSQDGTYVSENEYLISGISEGTFSSANYPTKYASAIAEIPPEQLALLATPGNCQNKNPQRVYLSARGAVDVSEKVTVFVSSGRSDVYLRIPAGEGEKATVQCSRIQAGARTAFDTLCHVEFSQLTKGVNELSLVRRKSGRTLPPIGFELVVEG